MEVVSRLIAVWSQLVLRYLQLGAAYHLGGFCLVLFDLCVASL